jgi:hypothetical protein
MKTLEKGKAAEESEVKKIAELTGELCYMNFTLQYQSCVVLYRLLLLLVDDAFYLYSLQ